MMAVELVNNGDADQPNVDLTKTLVGDAYASGLALLSCGTNGNVIRFLPPLTIGDDLISEGMEIFEACFERAVSA